MLIEEVKIDWYENIKNLCMSSRIVGDSIRSMCKTCDGNVKKISILSKEISKHSVIIPESPAGRVFREDFEEVYKQLCDKGRIGRLFKIFHPECEYILRECQVDGMNITNMDQVVLVMLSMEVKDMIKETARVWNNCISPLGGPVVEETLQGIIELEIPLEKLIRAIKNEEVYMGKHCNIKEAM